MDTINYREILEQSSAVMAVVNRDLKVLSVSDGFLGVTNHDRENIIGRPILNVFPEIGENSKAVFIHTLRNSLTRVLENKKTDTTRVVRFDNPITDSENGGGGKIRYLKVINTPILDNNHTVKYIQQIFVDVTHSEELPSQLEMEKENLDAYNTAEQHIRKAFKQAPTPICVLRGPKHVFELANRGFLRIAANKDIIGKPAREALPELEGQGFFEILDKVYETEKSYTGSETPATFNLSSSKKVDVYVDFIFQIVYDTNGKKEGVFILGSDVTKQVLARKKAEENEYKYRELIDELPVAMAVYAGPNNIIRHANDKMLNYWNKDESIMGIPLYDAVPKLREQLFLNDIAGVYDSGETQTRTEEKTVLIINGNKQTYYFNYTYKALREKDGDIYGVQNIVIDVTEQVLARKKVEESEYKYRTLIEESAVATALYRGPDFIIDYANNTMLDYFEKDSSIVGKPLRSVLPSLQGQPFMNYLEEIYATGETYTRVKEKVELDINSTRQTFYFNSTFTALRNKDGEIYGILNTAIDVTDEVLANKKVKKSEHRYRMLIEESPVATAFYTGPDIVVQYTNDTMLHYWGKDQTVVGKPLIEAVPELKGQGFIGYLKDVYATGKSYLGFEEEAQLEINGQMETGYFHFNYKALHDTKGEVYGIHHTAIDVTEQVLAKRKLIEREKSLQLMLNSMPQKISNAGPRGNVRFVNQQWIDETGYSFKELTDDGWDKTVHTDDLEFITEAWTDAVKKGTVFDVEARFLHKEKGYRWNLCRAVPVHDDKGEIIMWVGTNTDIHDQKKQKEILEKAVKERTRELERANRELIIRNEEIDEQKEELLKAIKNLESFTYISSHDLQEPLRKIQIFADRILEKETHNLSERGKDYFERMEISANRMQILLEDLLSFSRVTNTRKKFEITSFKKIIEDVKEELSESINKKNAIIETPELCDVYVITFQFRQLMKNLVSNAIKFSKPDVPPHIIIRGKVAKGSELEPKELADEQEYCHIVVSDNGIGFEPGYSERIFEVFKRLYGKDEYPGTGIGLAIAKKIVDNHDGIITAAGEPNAGATFNIYLPAE